jgi:uncharacterized protein
LSNALWLALGLMLVLEGIMPLVAPQVWRETFQRFIAMKDGQLRFVGLISILVGLVLILILS